MNVNITLEEARRKVTDYILQQPWVEKVTTNLVNGDLLIHSKGTGYIATFQVQNVGDCTDKYVIWVQGEKIVSSIVDAHEIDMYFELRIRPILIREYFLATAKRFIRLATIALEECGKDVNWVEGTIKNGKFDVGKYLNFGDTKIQFTYPKMDIGPTFSFCIDSSNADYGPNALTMDIGHIEDIVMSRVSKFISLDSTYTEPPVTDVSPISEDDKSDIQKDLDAICGDKPVVITSVDTLKALIDKYHS